MPAPELSAARRRWAWMTGLHITEVTFGADAEETADE
jgi:hypothetical protein